MSDDDYTIIKYKETCCKSYATSKGRCYTCPEHIDKDPDEELLS